MKQNRIIPAHNSQTSQSCYDQLNTCYDTAGPTGHSGCTAWERYCGEVKNGCSAGKFKGPPSADPYIPPPSKSLDESNAGPAPVIVGESDSSDTDASPNTNSNSAGAENGSGGSINTCGSNNGGLKCVTGMCCSGAGYVPIKFILIQRFYPTNSSPPFTDTAAPPKTTAVPAANLASAPAPVVAPSTNATTSNAITKIPTAGRAESVWNLENPHPKQFLPFNKWAMILCT